MDSIMDENMDPNIMGPNIGQTVESILVSLLVRLPSENCKRISPGVFPSTATIGEFKEKVIPLINTDKPLEFIYLGQVLTDNSKTFYELKIVSNTTINIFQKSDDAPSSSSPTNSITKEEISKAVKAFKTISSKDGPFKMVRKDECIAKILDAYPDFHSDLGAYAILRDSLLLGQMKNIRFAQKCAEHYPTLIRAAEFIANTIAEFLFSASTATRESSQFDWAMSPSSPEGGGESPSEGESSAAGSSQNSPIEVSRINRNQLEAALSLAATSANVTSTANNPTNSTNQNLQTVFRDFFANERMNQSSAATTPAVNENIIEQQQLYSAQLEIMREIGLLEDAVNLQALILCNGDVEAAINYVMLTNN